MGLSQIAQKSVGPDLDLTFAFAQDSLAGSGKGHGAASEGALIDGTLVFGILIEGALIDGTLIDGAFTVVSSKERL
jgi:hypothetical protein